ncbi:hypothetical protein PIB30_047637 [Stylosanthes scabra]|uniref:Uncharacterized protein n=1 Tax=Stylosanthes scabra TaxID=79078 RepID=A0ABU6TIZ0_9FABA|nr:hypothetical protein [Stylosanthes scabra]
MNRVPLWHPNHNRPGVPVEEYVTWHNAEYKKFLHLSDYVANQAQQAPLSDPEQPPVQSEQQDSPPHSSPIPTEPSAPHLEQPRESMFPEYGNISQHNYLPESASRHLSSYPQFMHSIYSSMAI